MHELSKFKSQAKNFNKMGLNCSANIKWGKIFIAVTFHAEQSVYS